MYFDTRWPFKWYFVAFGVGEFAFFEEIGGFFTDETIGGRNGAVVVEGVGRGDKGALAGSQANGDVHGDIECGMIGACLCPCTEVGFVKEQYIKSTM